jgi:hypothetical protein
MTPLHRVLVTTALIAACLPSAAAAQTPSATLPSQCLDQTVAPVSVVLTCGDGGFVAEDLVWSDWGGARPQASGTVSVNDCDPDCATGGRDEYPVTLEASELRDCRYGKAQYTRVTYSFPAATPFPPGSPGAEDPSVEFLCPKRPHANPKIRAMRMRLTGHNAPGSRYYVRVQIRLRICGVRGGSSAVFNETLRIGGDTFGRHTRSKHFRQTAHCQWRSFKWKLRDEFFGVGTYRVAATVWDTDSQFSKTVSRKQTTTD